MRRSRIAVFVTSILLAAATALTGATAAQASQQAVSGGYVALGDSYSSGVGAGSYISSSGDSHRSNSAYPALWASAHSPSSFTFAACSGAVTSDVTGSQLGGLNSSTGLVTLTIGGNDAGFSDVMTTCVTGSDSTCVNRVNQAETFVRNTLPGRLNTVYNAIRAKAPNARVVVLGYPDMYDLSAWFCVGLSDTKHQKINEAADVLDTTTASVAASHGFAFGDVRSTFRGHELCSGDDYLHSLVISPSWESYHPTATGHSAGYLPVLNAND